MPYNFKYKMGDKIYHKKLGNGIILGDKYNADASSCMAFYHVYYYDHNMFLYAIHATITKIADATDESRDEARQILLTKLLEPITDSIPRNYHMGDVFIYENKTHIILDNGRPYNGQIQYHICQLNGSMFHYSSLNNSYTKKPATKFTIKHAKNIIRDCFLLPAFS